MDRGPLTASEHGSDGIGFGRLVEFTIAEGGIMPELPEVETIVRDLRPLLAGRAITGVRHSRQKLRRPWKPAWNADVTGTRFEGLRRRGKWILLDLASPDPTPQPPPRSRPRAAETANAGEARHAGATGEGVGGWG